MNHQPEALWLADELEANFWEGRCTPEMRDQAAAKLRRLHAENASLLEQNTDLDAKLAEMERVNAQLLEALEDYAQYGMSQKARAAIAAAKGEA